ncbi:MAG: GTPase ObgE [Candidatus Pacebacteria bacterium]|nr:GTPase ObgE [Candidatus Paceibacterota bacterium]MCF7856968.1 GTPase ObgE [Candidatus Paceibacterota bacterium]
MFVDELEIKVVAGHGGNGVVRWRREKHVAEGGPSGGNGGKGGDIYMRAVRDLSLLSKYTGSKEFRATDGNAGEKRSKYGRDGEDLYIDVPVGATVTEHERGRVHVFEHEGQIHKILLGGRGGLGNEYFKSSTNRAPEESTEGRPGERGTFTIELSLIVDIGLVGIPNAGKTTILNALTHTKARVGAYPFTTVEPHLGELYGFILADIPGLIEGASEGKGLGHKFLRHIKRTKTILHCVSLEEENPLQTYDLIRGELGKFDQTLLEKEEWILLTKSDICLPDKINSVSASFIARGLTNVHVVSGVTLDGVKELSDTLVAHLRSQKI